MRSRLRYVSFTAAGAAILLAALISARGSTPAAHAVFNDSDGDSVIDLAEIISGSNPNDARSTPEDTGADTILGASLCHDGIDNDGDGAVDSNDSSCMDSDGDIVSNQMELLLGSNANDSTSFPEDARFDAVLDWVGFGSLVTCADAVDNDRDGSTDAADSGCLPIRGDSDAFDDRVEKLFGSDPANPNSVPEHEIANPGSCSDGIDNDLDGATDSADESCRPVDNDSIAQATNVASLPFQDSSKITTASVESGEPRPSCFFAIPSATVWYKYTPPSSGVAVADTTGSNFQNVIAVWTRHGARFSEAACASGFQSSPFSNSSDRAAFHATQGETYYIQIGGFIFPDQPGNLHFQLQTGSPPANDDYASPRDITALPFSDTVDARDATTEFGEPSPPCGYSGLQSSVWYRFVATSDSILVLDTSGSRYATAIAAWTNSAFGLTNVGCSAFPPRLALKVDAGRTYYLQISALSGVPAGDLLFGVETGVAPANDDFASAMMVSSLPFEHTVDTFTATSEFGEPAPSCSYGFLGRTVWYKVVAAQSGFMKALVDNSSSPGSSLVAIYQGTSFADLSEVACSNLYSPASVTVFRATAGQTYYIQTGIPQYRGGKFPTSAGGVGPAPTPTPAAPGVITFHLETFAVPSCPASGFTVADPTGDAIGVFGPPPPPGSTDAPLDITSVSGGSDQNSFCLQVQFAAPIPPANPNASRYARIEFDTDENPDTGYSGQLEYSCPGGADLGVEVGIYVAIPSQVLVPIEEFFRPPFPGGPIEQPEQPVAYAIFSGSTLQLVIPLDALGGDDAMRFAVAVNSSGTDCAPNGGAVRSPHPAVPGDVNCDGAANSIDSTLILQLFAGLTTQSLPCQYAGDVNQNGGVGPIDATLILQHESGMLGAFPSI
jgi:hypothetical protein